MPKKIVKKGKKKRKNPQTSERWKKYAAGEKRFCPRCGPGIFLGIHKNRLFCGRCHYTEFTGKKEEPVEKKKEKKSSVK